MSILFSATTRGFYDSGLNTAIPEDAVEITPEHHQALLSAQSGGMVIVPNESGHPVAQEAPPMSDEQAAAIARRTRDELLAKTDWVVIKAIETGGVVPEEYTLYRQALRQITDQEGFPHNIEWPELI